MKKIILITLLILSMTIISCTRDQMPATPQTDITAWKSHRINNLKLLADTWTDITWEEYIPEESLGGIHYLNNGTVDENKTILVIEGYDDIFSVQGCVHTLWNGGPGESVGIATRIMSSTDNGTTWQESRCLQYYDYNDKGTVSEGTHSYSGTFSVNETTWVKLQVQASDADLILQGHPIFDKPVSATIYLNNIGSNR